jgi:hypothetical protein
VNNLNIRPNIGILNALIRITFGLTILAWSTSKLVKRPWRDSYLLAAFMGAMKVAEGIVRYCPLTALYEQYQCKMQVDDPANESRNSMEGLEDFDGEEVLPYNPS